MFSGLIAYRGSVVDLEARPEGGATLRVRCEGVKRERPEVKDSIAIDGVCLTVTARKGKMLSFDVIPETLARSTLAQRRAGDAVNVEYSLRVGDRMGGHFVYGHVDATARVLARTPEGQGERVRIERLPALAPMLVEKAFVAVDGVSLTIAAARDDWFEIALIPETLARTTLGARPVGSDVNVEVDPIARYVVQRVGNC
ncbi:MAG TPA: riboflavin synthase [Candidatus Baltobacteraceae bacterium]|nr:riboflavin synthase [Candidatus Baltobacteraceae bacterium]